MKILTFLIVLWPIAVSSQTHSIFSVKSHEAMSIVSLADFQGKGQKEVCLAVFNKDTHKEYLVFLDVKTKRELANIPINRSEPHNWYSADIDGNGISEVVIFKPTLYGPTTLEEPGFLIYRWSNGQLFQTEHTEFFGLWGEVGNITGDNKDELILYHFPKPKDNDDGPVDILVLSWNGRQFEQIASVSLPRMSPLRKVEFTY